MSFGAFERLEDLARRAAPPIQRTADGLTLCVHFWNRAIRRLVNSEATQPSARTVFHLAMLHRGFYFGCRSFIGLSLPIDDSNVDSLRCASEDFMAGHGAVRGELN